MSLYGWNSFFYDLNYIQVTRENMAIRSMPLNYPNLKEISFYEPVS